MPKEMQANGMKKGGKGLVSFPQREKPRATFPGFAKDTTEFSPDS
jgi:hypothetical protein